MRPLLKRKDWLIVTALLAAAGTPARPQAAKPGDAKRANELTLAGLRPGKDSLSTAAKTFRLEHVSRDSRPESPEWADGCTGRFVRLELGRENLIEGVTVSSLGSARAECRATPPAWLQPKLLRTGRGLALGNTRKSVVATYGAPQSTGPSTHGGRELELLYYAFDWAGTEVPQVMEVTIEKGRVVQITLAFPSL